MKKAYTIIAFIITTSIFSQVQSFEKEVFTHNVGDLYKGGIIVSVYKDTNKEEHGLICSLIDLSTSQIWSNVDQEQIGITAQNRTDGQNNTLAIINQTGHETSAAKLCDEYINEGYDDWYLPAIWELNECYNAMPIVNQVLGDANGFHLVLYCSSTEDYIGNFAWYEDFNNGSKNEAFFYYKNDLFSVRAVRKF